MKTSSILYQRYLAIAAAAVLLLAVAMPVLITSRANAGQVTERFIRLSSSKVGQTSTTYFTSFKVTSTSVIRGIVVEICQNSPLVGITCTTTNGVTATPTSGTITFTNAGSSGDATFEVHANSTSTGRLITTDSDGATGGDGLTPVPAAALTFSFTATNPSGTAAQAGDYGTFYARILTYGVAATAEAYTSTAPGTHLDDGGVALSTAKQLTVSARVQEQLEFCVAAITGTIDSNAEVPANCATADFNQSAQTAVDLGVVDSGAASISPVVAGSGGNDRNGGVLVRTNAFNGATISYFAEQDTSSGRLKVTGAACSGSSGFDAGSSEVDQCFNSSTTQTSFAGTGEKFGMTAQKYFNATTNNLTRDTAYDGDGTAGGGFAWDQSGTNNPATTLASSTTVLDYELLVLRFAARSAATTPTGTYNVTSTYIATATF